MIIKNKKRIRNISNYCRHIKPGTNLIIGIHYNNNYDELLKKIGFSKNLEIGEKVLPSAKFGIISRINANGSYIIHKDQPKETAYREIEWHWKQWCGRGHFEEHSKIVDVPYKRYQRTKILPPSIELTISSSTTGNLLITSPVIEYSENNKNLLHIINLFLEIFHECIFFTDNLDKIINVPVKQLNWKILPKGVRPWEKLEIDVKSVLDKTKKGNKPVVLNRFNEINKKHPDFVAVGEAGFSGYVIFGFSDKNIYILESIFTNNATYIFENNWEDLSRKSKAEILSNNLQKYRIIHRENWIININKVFTA